MILSLLISSVCARPLSYFVSSGTEAWSPVPLSKYEGKYRYEKPLLEFPVIPLWPVGLHFDVDLMVALNDPKWGMIEIVKMDTEEDTPLWFTVDTQNDGRQFIGISENLQSEFLGSLLPVPMYNAQLKVEETDDWYHVSYLRGLEPITFSMKRLRQSVPPKNRNGNAMNHAQTSLLAVVDINSIQRTPVQWKEKRFDVQRILGQSISGVMSQTIAGFRKGNWMQTDVKLRQRNTQNEAREGEICVQEQTAEYCFVLQENKQLLHRIDLKKPFHTDIIAQMFFSPALPDFRFVPSDSFCSELSVVMHTRRYLTADVCIDPIIDGAILSILPHDLSWAQIRPMVTQIVLDESSKIVYGASMLLSENAEHKHFFSHVSVQEKKILIPKGFSLDEGQLLPKEGLKSDTVQTLDILVPIIPKEGSLQGYVVAEVPWLHPFILGAETHEISSDILGLDIGCSAKEGKLHVSVRLDTKKKIHIGGWMKVSIAEALHQEGLQSVRISGSGKGGGWEESTEPYFLQRVQVLSKKGWRDLYFGVQPRIESLPPNLFMEKTLFWFD